MAVADQVRALEPSAGPLRSLIAGILILVMPRLLNYIVAIYLIVIGLLVWRTSALSGRGRSERARPPTQARAVAASGRPAGWEIVFSSEQR